MILTIFTPTYNRVTEIQGLYESIKNAIERMSRKDYVEWLIVDDGSQLDVESVIKGFESTENLAVRYIYKENGGKHTAFNVGIKESIGDIFVCIDDDDRLSVNALEDIFKNAKKYENKGFGAVVGRVVNKEGELQGKTIFDDTLISNTIEIRDKYNFWGEPEVYFVPILKKYQFDVFEGERFLTEAYLFDEMSLKFPFLYTNDVFMVKEFLPGGLTDNNLSIRIKSPRGAEEYYYRRSRLCKGFKNVLKAIINRQRFSYWIESTKRIRRKKNIYEIIAFPISRLMIFRDKKRYYKKKR